MSKRANKPRILEVVPLAPKPWKHPSFLPVKWNQLWHKETPERETGDSINMYAVRVSFMCLIHLRHTHESKMKGGYFLEKCRMELWCILDEDGCLYNFYRTKRPAGREKDITPYGYPQLSDAVREQLGIADADVSMERLLRKPVPASFNVPALRHVNIPNCFPVLVGTAFLWKRRLGVLLSVLD